MRLSGHAAARTAQVPGPRPLSRPAPSRQQEAGCPGRSRSSVVLQGAGRAPVKTVDEHISDIQNSVRVLTARRQPLAAAQGCVLAVDVRATVALPGFDNAAMDGYAVRAADVEQATPEAPVRLPVTGEIAAGAARVTPVEPGTAVRIMTGAPFPLGADTVIQLEWTDGGTETVAVHRPAPRGLHIRRAGEDIAPGDLVLPAGALLGAAQIGLLAAVNVARPPVHPRPRVAVLSTGSELVDVGTAIGP